MGCKKGDNAIGIHFLIWPYGGSAQNWFKVMVLCVAVWSEWEPLSCNICGTYWHTGSCFMFANSFLTMSSDPYRLFTLRRTSDHIDLHRGWRQSSNLFLCYVSDSREHGRAIRQHSVDVQVLTHVQITLHDRIVWGLVDACRFRTKERGLEHGLRASKAPRSQRWWPDHREVHSSSLSCSSRQQSAFLFEVAGNIADIFFNVTRDHMG